MRTTVRMADALFREVKSHAARTGQSLNAFFEEAARARLGREREARKAAPVRLHTFKGRGVGPRVDLSDNASLLDIMERPDAPV